MHTNSLKLFYIQNYLLHVSTNHVGIGGKSEKGFFRSFPVNTFYRQDRSRTLSPCWRAGNIARFQIVSFLSVWFIVLLRQSWGIYVVALSVAWTVQVSFQVPSAYFNAICRYSPHALTPPSTGRTWGVSCYSFYRPLFMIATSVFVLRKYWSSLLLAASVVTGLGYTCENVGGKIKK